ncbi:hypothetical protein RS130_20040 [Paraglaciecola aquimarina]|uniref:Abortive infection protein n=1 Tax=Paraglaciecola aquimarina TaxID=1235557 RepID=A0ABU3T0U2_9ALTE|nr:hypothetical protein [Paraglaciecola aquimarina]MDU0355871.1 hypothetical protein [Paraglaciecola aquimarina]
MTDSKTVIGTTQSGATNAFLWLELIALFLLTPVVLAWHIHIAIKLCCVVVALTYCVVISRRQGLFVRASLIGTKWHYFTQGMALRLIAFMVISTMLIGYFLPEALFSVVRKNPLMWVAVSIFYALFSVYPQEFVYRVFFFKRYQNLVSNPYLFTFVNACLFSLAHSF